MNKKVYFAGSIRGGRNDAKLYKEIISYINRTDKVLTDHIGDLSLSAMLTGDSYFNIYPYEKEEDIFEILDEILSGKIDL